MDLQTQCTNSSNDNNELSNKKPYRSELNLVLAFPEDMQGSSDLNSQDTPPVPAPMELMTPTMTSNPLFLQNLPPPFPIPSSPLTPPTNFKSNDASPFEPAPDYSQLKFPPINAPIPVFTSTSSIFCTVSAPSTPASDRKCIDKFCINEIINDGRVAVDKKKAKRVSIFNNTKDEPIEKVADTPESNINEGKEGDGKKSSEASNGNHHSHQHRNHSHMHPKRRMSLDNTVVRGFGSDSHIKQLFSVLELSEAQKSPTNLPRPQRTCSTSRVKPINKFLQEALEIR